MLMLLPSSGVSMVMSPPPPMSKPPPDPPPGKTSPCFLEAFSPLGPPEPPDPPDSPAVIYPHSFRVVSSTSSPLALLQYLDLGFPILDLDFAYGVGFMSTGYLVNRPYVADFTFTAICRPVSGVFRRCGILLHLHLPIRHYCPLLRLLLLSFIRTAHGYSVPMLQGFLNLSSPMVSLLLVLPLQVCSFFLLSASPLLDGFKIIGEWLANGEWNPGMLQTSLSLSASVDFVLLSYGDTFNALVRSITAVCRPLSVFFLTVVASSSLPMWQLLKKTLINSFVPVILALDFHSPQLSSKELIILPYTLLVMSGIISGSSLSKVLRSALIVVEGVIFLTVEALFLPLGGLVQDDGKVCFCLASTLVELLSSHLSCYLCLYSPLSLTKMLFSLVCLAFYSHLYVLLLEIKLF